MSNVNLQGLPPEMQARIAEIIEKAKGAQGAMPQPAAPVTAPVAKPPSLMEHVIALRGEVAQLQQQVVATGQVVDAIGQATAQIYQAMFEQPAEPEFTAPPSADY